MPSTPQPPQPDDHLRASDEERDLIASLLSENTAEGRLELAEFDQRVTAVYTVKTRGELRALVADLPGGQLTPEHPRPVRMSSSAPAPQRREGHRDGEGGGGRPEHQLAPYASWLLTCAVCVTIWAATSVAAGTALYFWPFWVIVPWGVMLAGGLMRGGTPCGRPAHPGTSRASRGS